MGLVAALGKAFGSFADFVADRGRDYQMYQERGPLWKEQLIREEEERQAAQAVARDQARRQERIDVSRELDIQGKVAKREQEAAEIKAITGGLGPDERQSIVGDVGPQRPITGRDRAAEIKSQLANVEEFEKLQAAKRTIRRQDESDALSRESSERARRGEQRSIGSEQRAIERHQKFLEDEQEEGEKSFRRPTEQEILFEANQVLREEVARGNDLRPLDTEGNPFDTFARLSEVPTGIMSQAINKATRKTNLPQSIRLGGPNLEQEGTLQQDTVDTEIQALPESREDAEALRSDVMKWANSGSHSSTWPEHIRKAAEILFP